MTIEIKVPMLPESVADATILAWHKQVGDTVQRDENLVDLETDKVVLEVPSPSHGILTRIDKPVGTVVTGQERLAVIDSAAEAMPATAAVQPNEPVSAVEPSRPPKQPAALGPAARRAAQQDNRSVAEPQTSSQVSTEPTAIATERLEKRVPMTRLRAKIAERLVNAQQTAAMLTTFNEINLQHIIAVRQTYQDAFVKTHQIKLGFMSFFTKACVAALKQFPSVNASLDHQDIIYHGYYDIGVAVSTERGLVVPVLRNVDQMSLADIERAIADYAARARDNKLTIEEMTGGTFTITNGGVFGSLLSTPILNPPQTGILGMHKIESRPVVENNAVVIRPMMYVAFSYDHRLIDGKESVQFLATIKQGLEDPTRWILDI